MNFARLIGAVVLAVVSADYRVQFDVETQDGPASFTVKVHEEWAPIGAKRFKECVATTLEATGLCCHNSHRAHRRSLPQARRVRFL